MKKTFFVVLFIFVHIGFIFLQIHKSSQFIKQSYRKQRNELAKADLLQKKQDLTHRLCTLKNRTAIKSYAMKKLGMEKTKLAQLKKL